MKIVTTIFLFLVSLGVISAQNNKQITIIGSVTEKDLSSIPSANIVDLTTQQGTITDKNGVFRIVLPKKSTTLTISFIGFTTIEKEISDADIEQLISDTLYLLIVLAPKAEELEMVEISSDRFERAYDKPKIQIIDYDFRPEGLLLLLVEDKNHKLRLVDDNSKILFDLSIPAKPQNLFKDCFNNLHIQYKDSIFQIIFENKGFTLMEGLPIEKFYNFLFPCVAVSDDNLFFREYGLHNQTIFYYRIHKDTKQKTMVQEIADSEKMIATDDFYHDIGRRMGFARHLMADNSAAQQRFSRKVEQDVWFYQGVLTIPTYNPLLMVRDSVFIFNHVEGTVFVYSDNGILQRSFSIDYQNRVDWNNELIIDYSGKGIYARLNKVGLTYLMEINPDNGQVLNEFKLDKNLYPSNIKIRDGYAYYLYTDRYDLVVSNVYRQKLE